jgi:hypothetical protein
VIIDHRVGHAFPNLSLSRLKYREIYRCVKPREWGTRVLDRERIGGPCSCACAVWLALWPANNCAARSSSVVVVAAVLYLWKQQEDGQGQRMGRSSRAKDSPRVRAHGMVLRRNVRAFFGGLGTTRRRGVRAPGTWWPGLVHVFGPHDVAARRNVRALQDGLDMAVNVM